MQLAHCSIPLATRLRARRCFSLRAPASRGFVIHDSPHLSFFGPLSSHLLLASHLVSKLLLPFPRFRGFSADPIHSRHINNIKQYIQAAPSIAESGMSCMRETQFIVESKKYRTAGRPAPDFDLYGFSEDGTKMRDFFVIETVALSLWSLDAEGLL